MFAGHLKSFLKALMPVLTCLLLASGASLAWADRSPAGLPPAQDLSSEQVNAAAWSEEQIQARIRELEAERMVRMALMLPETKNDFLADPQTWLIGLAVLLVLSMFCLGWLLHLMRRWKNQEWQASVIMDWEEPANLSKSPLPPMPGKALKLPQAKPVIGQHKSIHATLGASGFQFNDNPFDAIEYQQIPLPTVIDDEDQEYNLNPHFEEGISVIEETGALQQAQFWAALDKPEVAIEILEQYYEQDRAPNSWLLLFDLYRKTGQRDKYDILKRRFKCIFNARVPGWEEKWHQQSRLKDMPELAQRINRFLSGNSIMSFLEGLLFDNRGGTRRGFEFGVYCDLVTLFDTLCAGQEVADCESVCQ